MFTLDFGTILLYAVFVLLITDIILLIFNSKIHNWKFYDHTLLYFAAIAMVGSFFEFVLNLIAQDYSYAYVYHYSSADMDIPLRIASSWSGAVGSFFLWTMLMFTGYLIFRFIFRNMLDQRIYQYASIIQVVNLLAFLIFILIKDPFERLFPVPTNGTGLNPLLATFLNEIHPPIIFLGYSIFMLPFSIALAKLITGLTDDEAPAEIQKFMRLTMALGWLVLGTGILIGGYWAYTTLGWGGFWAWDPVETGSLIPWLFALVFFHGSPVFKLDKGNFGKDIIATFPFLSVLFATIVTRTGLLSSVHAFGISISDYIIIVYLLFLLAVEIFFVIQLYNKNKVKFFFTIEELTKIKRQDAALYISFFSFLIGTLAIMTGLIIPLIFAMLPEPFNRSFIVDKSYFNSMIALFGFGALEAAFFTDFVFIKKDKDKFTIIGIGVTLGLINVFLNLPVVDFYLKRSNLGIIYDLLHILSTSSLKANFITPILVISLGVLIITIYKFFKSTEMQKQIKMRKISQTFLHLGIIIALIGALFSYNNTQINEVPIAPGESQFITTSQTVELKVLDTTYQHDGPNYAQKITAHVQLIEGNHVLGSGILEYTDYTTFGLIVNVMIISSLTSDYYLTIITGTVNAANDGITELRIQARIIPMISFLWFGAGVVLTSMAVLVVVSFRLFMFSYKKAQRHSVTIDRSPKLDKMAIKG